MVRIKICGITNIADAQTAAESGADALGFIFYPGSRRFVDVGTVREIIRELPPFITTVGVFVNETAEEIRKAVRETGIDIVQLHGDETAAFCKTLNLPSIKVIRVRNELQKHDFSGYQVGAFLLDTFQDSAYGGTGKVFNWEYAKQANKYGRMILSGGLTPENVRDAIAEVNPYAVDTCSSVELEPGIKDKIKLRQFVGNARNI